MGHPLRNTPSEPIVSELEVYAADVFGDRDTARAWLDTPLWELGNRTPREALIGGGKAALQAAKDILVRIEYGVYS